MTWIGYTIVSTFIWASLELADKFIVDHEIKDPVFNTGLSLFFNFLIIIGLILFSASNYSFSFSWLSVVISILYVSAIYFYYSGMNTEEVSRFAPTLSLTAVFIVVLGALFLGEVFFWVVYLGVALTILGAFLISLEEPVHSFTKFESKQGILFAVLASLFFAARELMTKYSSGLVEFWDLLFWIGITGIIISIILIVNRKNKINRKNKRGIINLSLVGVINGVGYFLFLKAIELGPVSLVSSIAEIDAVIIFLGSSLISKISPKSFNENLSKKVLVQKGLAIIFSLLGVTLIHLFN